MATIARFGVPPSLPAGRIATGAGKFPVAPFKMPGKTPVGTPAVGWVKAPPVHTVAQTKPMGGHMTTLPRNVTAPPRYVPAPMAVRPVVQAKVATAQMAAPARYVPAAPVQAKFGAQMPVANRMPAAAVPNGGGVVQRNKHWKRFLNVVSLGGRKAYVANKRAQRAAANVGVIAIPNAPDTENALEADVDTYVRTYNSSRYFHNTFQKNMDGATGIRATGLQVRYGGTGLATTSGMNNDIWYNKNTVHLTDARQKEFYNGGLGATARMRPFLPADRIQNSREAWDPSLRGDRDRLPQLFRDKEHGDEGIWITGADIPPHAINFGTNEELGEQEGDEIFEIIATHWPGRPPDVEELRELHREAVRQRRLSL